MGDVAISAATWAGVSDAHQVPMAAGLELRADGRFGYALALGALDEEAEGRRMIERAQGS